MAGRAGSEGFTFAPGRSAGSPVLRRVSDAGRLVRGAVSERPASESLHYN
jgi:hypothetical protein